MKLAHSYKVIVSLRSLGSYPRKDKVSEWKEGWKERVFW